MQKRISIPLFLIGFFIIGFAQAQVKIGDNPQTIDPSSILELESSNKVLVITRVDESQMASIVPNRGAMVYNTTADCIYYYDGTAWISMCEAAGGLITDPELNAESTIAITPTPNGNTIEIAPNSINSEQIRDGGINGIDIQDGSIGQGKLQDNSVTQNKLAENSVGAFALDNDNINLSDFTNDQGFITSADIVSANAGNSITPDANGAAFFDASTLENNIAANTTAIAADGDTNATNEIQILNLNTTTNELSLSRGGGSVTLPTSSGSDTKIIDGTNTTVSGTGVVGDEYRINVANEVDGSITNELITSAVLNAANELVITEPGNLTTVDLSPLAGGGDDDQTAAEVPFTATGNTTSTNVQDAIVEIQTEVDGLSAGGEANTASNAGIGGVGITLTKSGTDLPFKSINAGDAGIISVTDDAANNEIDIDIIPATAPITSDKMLITNSTSNQVEWADIPTGTTTPTLAEVLATAGGNSAGNLQITNLGDPTAAQDAATKKYVDDNNALPDAQIFVGDAAGVKQAVALSGDATIDNTGVLTIQNDSVTSAKIKDGTITLDDLSDMGATSNGEIIQWDTSANSGAGGWTIADNSGGHNGTAKAIFYADDDGTPTTADDNDNTRDDGGFYYDPEGRKVSGSGYGALYIGLDGGPQSTEAKVHIADNFAGVAYALQLQNQNANTPGKTTGILFSTETVGTFGKGALVYERQESWARGDFHFLQNDTFGPGTEVNPTLADKAFTIKNNKDIVLYNGIEIAGDRGDDGQVLTSTGTGAVTWKDVSDVALPTGGAADQLLVYDGTDATWSNNTATKVKLATPIDIDGDTTPEEDVEAAINKLNDLTVKGTTGSIFFADTDGSATDENSELYWSTADKRLGIGTNSPSEKLHINGNVEISNGNLIARNGAGSNEQVLTTNASGETVWATPDNLSATDITLTEDRTIEMDGNDFLFDTDGGNVGIGDLPGAPQVQLDVNGAIRSRGGFEATGGTDNNPGYGFFTNGDSNTGMFRASEDNLGLSTAGTEALRVDASQNVGIGTATPVEKLHVAGNVQVDGTVSTTADISSGGDILLNGNTVVPDYVFQKYFLGSSDLKEDYHFNNLKEIEAFIKKNHHLPGVTSAVKAQEEGHWNLSESNLQNLEKIEELFLHTIEQEKEIHKLKAEKEAMAQELKSIKNDLEEIKALLKK
ncbi:vacuolar protein sorting family 37 protein [Zobellia galactanivorans]|uniref:Conserved hypothetical periplasmic protein n=1 Tax=Zobellia galactanivorans (strain DSM 12802 / CCUG 47099 / CIP 106680 / NCIMB 13871 / Dsij) TaxID=63186 RepID=G0L9S9_ZOBGA|nr:TMF family protein [Zobellia galactanivorans]CAZ94799.1 Conserved hypothetical periplasmic protein [Zobellia galactanivorans]